MSMIENLEHGFWHHFRQTMRLGEATSHIELYNGEENLILACTQLGTSSKFQNLVVDKWCNALINYKLPIKKLWITTRISQKIFDAVCHQSQLEGLYIKWGVFQSIQNIENLTNLRYLHLGGGSSIKDLTVLLKLKKLKSLETDRLYNINDYSFLTELKKIVDLSIEGDEMATMKKVNLKSLKFLESMPQIIRLNLTMTKIEDHSYLPILKIKSLKYLSLPNDRDLTKDIALFKNLIQ